MLIMIIKILIAIAAAVLFGNASVVMFNHMPEKWFEDWDDSADSENPVRRLPPELVAADNSCKQRIPSTPWKYLFVGMFGICGIYLSISSSVRYEIAVLVVLFIALEMAIADWLYKIVPDQLQILLAVSSLGLIGYYDSWWEPLAGAGIGLAISLSIYGLGMLLFKAGSIGGADMKFYTCMGLVVGRSGIVIIFVLTTIVFAIEAAVRIATKRGSIKDSNAMLPSAFVASFIYLVFLCNIIDTILL